MKKKGKKINLNKIDLISLKRKGLTSDKISKMVGVSTRKIEAHLKFQQKFKQYSGVF